MLKKALKIAGKVQSSLHRALICNANSPIPTKAVSYLLSRCGSSNRYPVRPAEKKHSEGGNPVSFGKSNNGTGNYDANISDNEEWKLFFLDKDC